MNEYSTKEETVNEDVINKQREEILNLENTIAAMKSEITYALSNNKTEEVRRHYLENAIRYANKVIHIK